MSYNKTIWSTGDTITASLANNWETQYDEAISWAQSFGLGGVTNRIDEVDLNTITETGFYSGDLLTNSPTSDAYFIIHVEHDSGGNRYATQKAISLNQNGVIFERNLIGGTWSAWTQTATQDWVQGLRLSGKKDNSDLPSSYPDGVSSMQVGLGFPTNAGTVITTKINTNRTFQILSEKNTTNNWIRTSDSDTWNAWQKIAMDDEVVRTDGSNDMSGPLTINESDTAITVNGWGMLAQYFDAKDFNVIRFYTSDGTAQHASIGYDTNGNIILNGDDVGGIVETTTGAQSKADTAESNAKSASMSNVDGRSDDSITVNGTGGNAHYWLEEDGVRRALVYWNTTAQELYFRVYDTDGSTVLNELRLPKSGAIEDVNGYKYAVLQGNGDLDLNDKQILAKLVHTNSYFEVYPYSSSYDDGSKLQTYYDGNNRKLRWQGRDGSGNITPVDLDVDGRVIVQGEDLKQFADDFKSVNGDPANAIIGKGGTLTDGDSDGYHTKQEMVDGINSVDQYSTEETDLNGLAVNSGDITVTFSFSPKTVIIEDASASNEYQISLFTHEAYAKQLDSDLSVSWDDGSGSSGSLLVGGNLSGSTLTLNTSYSKSGTVTSTNKVVAIGQN